MEQKLHSPYSDSTYMKFFRVSSESIQYTWKKYGKTKKYGEDELHQIADGIERSKKNALYKTHEYLYARPEIDGLTRHYIFDCLELGYPIDKHIDLNSTPEKIKKVRDAVVRTLYQKNIDEFGPIEKEQPEIDPEKLEEAKELIREYIMRDLGPQVVPLEFTNLKKIPLAHRQTPLYGYNLQAEVNLIDNQINKYINGIRRYHVTYESLDDLIEEVLKNLSYENLTFLDEKEYRRIEQKQEREQKKNMTRPPRGKNKDREK